MVGTPPELAPLSPLDKSNHIGINIRRENTIDKEFLNPLKTITISIFDFKLNRFFPFSQKKISLEKKEKIYLIENKKIVKTQLFSRGFQKQVEFFFL